MPMTATPSARGLAGRGRGQPRRTAGRSGMLLLRSSLKEYRLQLLQICTDNTALCPQLPSLTESLACKWRLLRLPPSWRPCARVPCSTQDRAKRIRLRSIRARLRLRCSIPFFKGATVQGFYLISAVGAVAHHGRQLHIVSHQVHIRMTES